MLKTAWNEAKFSVKRGEAELATIFVKGSACRELESWIEVGSNSGAPTLSPALRWAADVCKARRVRVAVETQTELHTLALGGTHARCLLRDLVERVA